MKTKLLKYRKPEIVDGFFCAIGESLDKATVSGRTRSIRPIHKHSGQSVLYLRPAKWITTLLLVIFGGTTVTLFLNPILAAIGFSIGMGIAGFLIASFSGTAFACETVGEASSATAQEQYWVWRKS